MHIVDRPSPNHARRLGVYGHTGPRYIVLHYSGMDGPEQVLQRLTDAHAEKRVSAHYFVEQAGQITRLVDEEQSAWHAGGSFWRNETQMNSASIGIELDHRGHARGYMPFPDAQIEATAELVEDIMFRWGIPPENVVAHSDIAPQRKQDPGELYPFKAMAKRGQGIWPEIPVRLSVMPKVIEVQRDLAAIGFNCPVQGRLDVPTREVVTAFQRHWLPEALDQGLTLETAGQIKAVRATLDRLHQRQEQRYG